VIKGELSKGIDLGGNVRENVGQCPEECTGEISTHPIDHYILYLKWTWTNLFKLLRVLWYVTYVCTTC